MANPTSVKHSVNSLNPISPCRTAVIFWTWKIVVFKLRLLTECFILVVWILTVNLLTVYQLNNRFSYWNVLQNGVNVLSKNGYEKLFFFVKKLKILFILDHIFFLSKSSKFYSFWTIWFGPNFASIFPKYTYQIVYGKTFDLRCQNLQRQHGRVSMANLLQKLIRSGILCYHYPDIGSLKLLHTLFDMYLDHMLVNLNLKYTKFWAFW